MPKIAKLWNKLADPKNIPRLFALILGLLLIAGFLIPVGLDTDQIYTRPAPQSQMDAGLAIAPYDRGGEILFWKVLVLLKPNILRIHKI